MSEPTGAAQDAGIFAAAPQVVIPPVASAGASWAHLKTIRRNVVRSVRVTLRGDLLDEVARLEEDMAREARADEWENRDPIAPSIARQIQALEAEARESEVLFRFEGLGQGDFALLLAAHPATPELKARLGLPVDADLEWNPETFPPALMAASCIEPKELTGDLAEWTEIHQKWSNGQVTRIWGTCMTANAMVAETPKSLRASEILRQADSKNSSTTASP
jgi:hypothetical protein